MGAALPVYMLNINRTVISPQINATTDNFYQVWLGSPPNTVYLRAGDLTEKDCFTVWQPFNAGGSGGTEARTFFNATFELARQFNLACVEIKNADWGGVASDPICTETTECPDVIVLGTTQVAGRVSSRDLLPLNALFNDFASKRGEVFSDNFIQKYFYDYFYNEEWMGIPLTTDIRIGYYNKTTFDALNLKYPPPHGVWAKDEWNWKKFTEYATIIKNSGRGYGFDFISGWDEELKLVTMAARDYQATLLNTAGRCGYNDTRFGQLYNEVLAPLFGPNGAANPAYVPLDNADLQTIISSPLIDPLRQPMVCCSWSIPGIVGMTIDAPSWNVYVNNKYHPTLFPSGTIGQVYVPGKATFLGGTGMAITQKSKRKELAWKYLEMFSQPTFSTILNVGLNTLSPYYTVMETATEWSSAEYDTIKEQYKKAVPVQYPQSSFPQFTDLEGRKPFRALLIEITYKNYPLESLQQRMCKVVDHVMLPACKVDHMMISDKGCDLDTMSRNLTYSWAVDRPCRGGMSLPQDISLLCPVVPMKSRLSIGMMATAGIVMVIIVLLMVLVHIYQERPAIKKSSYIFTQLMLVGGIVATVGVYFMADTTGLCGVDYWFLGYGFILLMGSITLKMTRIIKIFSSQFLKLPDSEVKDSALLKKLGFLCLVQTGLLLIYQFVDQPRMATVAKTVTGTAISYTETKCATTSTIGATIILVCNLLVLLNGIRLVYTGRTIPNQFNDGKVMGIMVYTMTLLLLVVLLGSLFVNDPRFLFLLHSCSTLLIALSSAVVHTVPKLFQTMEEYSQKSQVSVQDQVKRCKNCGFIDQSIVGGSYAISSTGGPD